MLHVPSSQRLSLRFVGSAALASLLILGGCGRAGGNRHAERGQNQAEQDVSSGQDRLGTGETDTTGDPTGDPRPQVAAQAPERLTPRPESTAPVPRAVTRVPQVASQAAQIASASPSSSQALSIESSVAPPSTARLSRRPTRATTIETRSVERIPMVAEAQIAAADPLPSVEVSALESSDMAVADGPLPGEHLSQLPAGSQRNSEQGFATIQVYYATDRLRGAVPLSAYEVTGQKQTFTLFSGCALLLIVFAGFSALRGRTHTAAVSTFLGGASGCMAAAIVVLGQANIEKHGVTYSGERGDLTRGICEVTVPDIHRRGLVERPSLLRFEVRENQQQHIVLTSAVELSAGDFQTRLAETIQGSPDHDLLVFVHGYNVDFESAVRRTAQIAVDLPFEGVPVCYSWPSQGSLIGYSIDENNSEWTVTHLKEFLLELANESGAKSINVVAHSMGNRALTAAMQQISWQVESEAEAPFDRIVLAAPDVDADRFRRDFAPSLLRVANQVTLYASSDDQALFASKQVHGYPRAGESGDSIVVVPGIETIDVSGIDLSLLGHSYYGDNESMLRDLYEVVRARLPAPQRDLLITRSIGPLVYWELAQRPTEPQPPTFR